MSIAEIDTISQRLQTAQQQEALTDRATAAAVQLWVRSGSLPEEYEEDQAIADPLRETAWLLFLAAPAIEPRYLVISSMHLNLVLTGDRPMAIIFDELASLESRETVEDEPLWLEKYRTLGDPLPEDREKRHVQLEKRFQRARQILTEHHEEVRSFTRQILDSIATEFDRDVEQGMLSPLGARRPSYDNADDALEAARQRQEQGDLEGAEHLYGMALELADQRIEALVERGILRASLEDLRGARDDFDRALALDDTHLVARLNRGLVNHSLGEVSLAIDDYDRALSSVDDDPEIYVNRGIARFSAGDLEGAEKDFDHAVELDDTMATAYLHRGNLKRIQKKVGAALDDYRLALESEPKFVDAYAARAYLHLQLEQAKKAIDDYGRAISLQPSDPSLYYNRAHAHLLRDDVDAAISDYDRALELDPQDVETLSNRGAVRMISGDLDGAVQDWESAIAIDPYYPTPYLKRASMWLATDQPDEAARDLQIALDNAPDDWPYRQKVEETLQNLLDELGFDEPH